MKSPSAQLHFHQRNALLALVVATQSWLACTEADSPAPGAAGRAGSSEAGSPADGGETSCAAGQTACDVAGAADAGSAGAALGESAGAAGVGGSTDGGEGGGENGGFVPAPHAPFPLVTAHGGPVIEHIEIAPVYFGDDPLIADLESFNTWVVASSYWKQVTAEYGVSSGTRLPAVHVSSAPTSPISDTQIASWIDARVADGTLPKPSASTVFALFYPPGTTLTNWTGSSCHSFAGLHETAAIANPVFTGEVPFILIPRCSYSPGDELEIATDVASHEYLETATNPFDFTNPGWIMDNASGPLEAWGILSGPAVADLCLNQSYDEVEGYSVQDIWSNAAAKAGNNPCQPSDPKHPFFSVSAEQTIYHATPGSTVTIHARAWSNIQASDWTLGINWGLVPYSDFDGQAALSKLIVNNGDEVTATVTIPVNPPVTDGRSQYRFTIDSIDPINPNFSHPWPFLVVVP